MPQDCELDTCGSGQWQIARSVAEPGSLALLGLGLALSALTVARRRRHAPAAPAPRR